MIKYKIVYVKDEYMGFIKTYPRSLKKLLLNETSMFDTKQLQTFFLSTYEYIKDFEDLFSRDDYSYFHGIHKITNQITDNEVTFEINIYDIEVNENECFYVIFDYLRQFSQNFCLIEL